MAIALPGVQYGEDDPMASSRGMKLSPISKTSHDRCRFATARVSGA
jgi:hypothetical protein